MKLSFLTPLFLAVSFLIIPSAPVLADGYWQQGKFCSQENNYCRETWGNSHNGGWDNQNYYYQPPESIEYNNTIIRTGISPGTRICPLVRKILGHCDGYIGFNESTRTHIFRNYSQQQYYQNNQWGNRQQYRDWRNPTPNWNRGGGCVYQDKNIRVLCD
jgi:hypothetical protein